MFAMIWLNILGSHEVEPDDEKEERGQREDEKIKDGIQRNLSQNISLIRGVD